MTVIFWFVFLIPIYCYFGYPGLIYFLARIRPQAVKKGEYLPNISVVIAVWNEADVIEKKIRNLLALDYPSSKVEFVIGSDGSTDRTNEILQQFHDPRVKFLLNPVRRGKSETLNELIKMTHGDVLVFTDARQIFSKDALRQLVNNFADPRVGCVSGELVFGHQDGGTARGINLYWNYEKFIRRQESRVHSMLGATGAIYAVRRYLYTPAPRAVVLDDMYIPFQVILRGYRAIFDDTAKAYDAVADNPQEEHRRKARTIYGNYQIFSLLPQMFNPRRSPVAFQLFSHKFLRLVVPFALIFLLVSNFYLLDQAAFRFIFAAQMLFYGLAVVGSFTKKYKNGILRIVSLVCYVPYVFCLLNLSALAGFWRFVTARQQITWQKARA